MQHAGTWALLSARLLTLLAHHVAPAIWLLSHATDLRVGLFGGDLDRVRQEVSCLRHAAGAPSSCHCSRCSVGPDVNTADAYARAAS
ncbi:MAG: hypothetical protein LC679_08665 [Intrasporangiaceae bacterium]|nr:hypothetical protein [Intrasporangiaceae bacterium]